MQPARKRHALELFAGLPKRYHAMGALLSFGQDPRWRRMLVDAIAPRPGLRVADVATGTGLVALALAARGCEVVALDQSEAMLGEARARAARRPELAARLRFVRGEAEQLPFADAEFDALSFTYLLRYVDDPQATLRELARVVKPGGAVASLEFYLPPSRFWRAWWWLYTRFVLPAGGWLTGGAEWYRVGRFLGPNISGHYKKYPLAWTEDAWRRAGFENVGVRIMSLGGGLVMWGTRSSG